MLRTTEPKLRRKRRETVLEPPLAVVAGGGETLVLHTVECCYYLLSGLLQVRGKLFSNVACTLHTVSTQLKHKARHAASGEYWCWCHGPLWRTKKSVCSLHWFEQKPEI